MVKGPTCRNLLAAPCPSIRVPSEASEALIQEKTEKNAMARGKTNFENSTVAMGGFPSLETRCEFVRFIARARAWGAGGSPAGAAVRQNR